MSASASNLSEGATALSGAQYRELFQDIREAFFVGELVRDERGRATDFVFLEINEAFVRQTGATAERALGHRVREVFPGLPGEIIDRYAKVVGTGEPAAFEFSPALSHRSFETRAHPLGGERFAVLFLEITERKRIERELEESRALLSDIVESVDQIVWSARPDGHHDFFNKRWHEFTGASVEAGFGEEWMQWFHSDDRERATRCWQYSLATGAPYEIEYRLWHRSGEYRWVLCRAHPVRNDRGEIIRWMGTCTDIHTHKAFAEQLELASSELNHRIKNIFAVISGLLTLSARRHPEAQGFADELLGRIDALRQAHDYARPQGASAAPRQGTVLGIVRLLLDPYAVEGSDRIVVEGDDTDLDENAVTPVALAVHELATNAAKYGAFSVPGGQVRVRGEFFDDHYRLCWKELGGPPVQEPDRFGFGSRLVDVSLRDQLHGELTRNWQSDGLEVCLSAPVDRLARGPAAPVDLPATHP